MLVHYLAGNFGNNGSGPMRIAFHITNNKGVGDKNNKYPGNGGVSEVPGLGEELSDLGTGALYEHVEGFRINITGLTQEELDGKALVRHAELSVKIQKKLNDNFKFYGKSKE